MFGACAGDREARGRPFVLHHFLPYTFEAGCLPELGTLTFPAGLATRKSQESSCLCLHKLLELQTAQNHAQLVTWVLGAS